VVGTGGFRTGFTSTWGALASPGGVVTTTTSYSAGFSVSIDPAVVAAGSPRELRITARASYTTTAFAVGRGNVAAGFEFSTYIPILVRYTGTAPNITQQPTPASVSVVENTSFTLAAVATGPNLTYEWRHFQNATDSAIRPAEGANNQASYSSPPAQLGWNGRLYYVQVCTNRGVAGLERCAASQASPLTVTPFTQPIAFTTQPVARDILEGESTTFNATVTGTPTPTLQWHYGVTCSTNFFGVRNCSGTPFANGAGSGPLSGATVAGATTGSLTLSSVPLAANGTQIALRAQQPGALDQWSSVAGLAVRARPAAAGFVQQLQSRSAQQNGSVDFAVVTSGTAPISYFWSIDGGLVSMPGPLTTGRCAGATVSFPSESALRLTNVPLGCDGAVIAVGIENVATPAGTRPTSAALLTVTAIPTPPSITTNPAPSTVNEGQRATLTVGYGGTLPQTLTLQCLNCAQIGTGVSTTSQQCASPCSLQTPVLDASDNGNQYRIVHSNAQGDTATAPVTVTVSIVRTPSFISQPAAATVDSGQTASFSFAVASDTGSFAYQWLANGQPLADGSNVAGNGALQGATVSGASGTGTSGTLTLTNVPLAANGVALTVRVTRTAGGQTSQATSNTAALTVNTSIPANALTATQVEAGYEWSLVLRPDRTVWAWGGIVRNDGRVQYSGLLDADRAMRPVQLYPAALTDIRAISGWNYSFWALKGEPGTTGSRVLHWGRAIAGSDGRGGDGNGSLGNSIPPRENEAATVQVLERVNNVPQPVDRVCAIAGGGEQLAMIRAINSAGDTTDCNAGSAKTVWLVGALIASRPYESTGVAFAMPGLPTDSPPAAIFTGKTTSGSPPLVIALEDGRLYGRGPNNYGGLGIAAGGSGEVGGLSGPAQLPSTWGNARSFGMSFYYSLFVVRADGSVMTSGYDNTGELGLGSVVGGSTLGPLPVKAESCAALPCADVLSGVTAIAGTTAGVTLALKSGQILGWGAAANSLRGPGATGNQPFPRPVPSAVAGFTALSASNAHALVIGPGNVVYAWGSGLRGALGDGANGNTRTAPGLVTIGP
jgi:alpha-tubulin suppressor-like RCC1 family protein